MIQNNKKKKKSNLFITQVRDKKKEINQSNHCKLKKRNSPNFRKERKKNECVEEELI